MSIERDFETAKISLRGSKFANAGTVIPKAVRNVKAISILPWNVPGLSSSIGIEGSALADVSDFTYHSLLSAIWGE